MFIKFDNKLINFDLIGYVELNEDEYTIEFNTKEDKLMCRCYFNCREKLLEEYDKLYNLLNKN